MKRLVEISKNEDIFLQYQNTPIEKLLQYHNLGRKLGTYSQAQLLVGMCIDNRKYLNIPGNFAFVIRSGGANLKYSQFKVSYAISLGGIKHIALIGHTECGMVNLAGRKEKFIQGLVESGGWERKEAEEHFVKFAPKHEIGNEIDFIIFEANRIRGRYPKITVAPMIYNVENKKLCLVNENC